MEINSENKKNGNMNKVGYTFHWLARGENWHKNDSICAFSFPILI